MVTTPGAKLLVGTAGAPPDLESLSLLQRNGASRFRREQKLVSTMA